MPLNDALYERLVQKFGLGNVNVVRVGEPYVPNWQFDPITGRKYRESIYNGEAYQLNCPFCGDRKGRMYVNHTWMQWDPDAMKHSDDMIKCFNETNCFQDHNKRSELFQLLFGGLDPSDLNIVIRQAEMPKEEVKPTPPGLITPLSMLPPGHPCLTYLSGRGYDPKLLSDWWNVGYVTNLSQGFHESWADRIYIPLYHRGELVGYQCRYVGNREWTADCPKSRTMYRMKRGRYLYNYDLAARSRIVVITEGPTSAWAVGPRAVALWGRTLTTAQVELLRATWGPTCLIVVLLDGDAALDSDKSVVKLRAHCPTPVLQVKLMQSSEDPGSLGGAECWNRILAEGTSRGIDVPSYFVGDNVASANLPSAA